MAMSNRYIAPSVLILLVLLLGCRSMIDHGGAEKSCGPYLKEGPLGTTRGSGDRASVTVDLTSLPQHITLTVGERKVILLPSYANSGNTWSATCVRGHGLVQLSVKLGESPMTVESQGSGTAEPPPLVLTPEYAVVIGLASGEAVYQLVLSRTFGPTQVVASHELQITVVAARE